MSMPAVDARHVATRGRPAYRLGISERTAGQLRQTGGAPTRRRDAERRRSRPPWTPRRSNRPSSRTPRGTRRRSPQPDTDASARRLV